MPPYETPVARRPTWYEELIIRFQGGVRERLYIDRSKSGTHRPRAAKDPAPWTRLEHFRCPGCPLSPEERYCPAALSMEQTLDKLQGRISYEVVNAEAIDGEGKSYFAVWPLQNVGAVLVQLAVFAGGCPLGMRYKPFLAGLPPFAGNRALAKHLVSRLLRVHGGAIADCRDELKRAMDALREVLTHLCMRLTRGRGLRGDAVPNAIVAVDAFAGCLALQADELIREISGDAPVLPAAPPGR